MQSAAAQAPPLAETPQTQMKQPLPLSFYQRSDVVQIAQDLLGKWLFSQAGGILTAGIITETEAYAGASDRASHAYQNKRTARNQAMYLAGGCTYVYICYGMHHLLNIVTNKKEVPHAVLIRAIHPVMGVETMKARRKDKHPLAAGPGTLSQALAITKKHNALSLVHSPIWIEDRGTAIPKSSIQSSPRIGVDYAQEDALLPWRFFTTTPLERITLLI